MKFYECMSGSKSRPHIPPTLAVADVKLVNCKNNIDNLAILMNN